MNELKHTLFVCTVGGSPEPIVAALKQWKPVRIHFVPTKETREQIEARVVPLAQSEGLSLDPGRYDLLEVSDGQDFAGCVDALRQLTPVVEEWLGRGDQYQVVVDFTGGTAGCYFVSSPATAVFPVIVAGRLPHCLFSRPAQCSLHAAARTAC